MSNVTGIKSDALAAEMRFEGKKHYGSLIRLTDHRVITGVNVRVSHWLYGEQGSECVVSMLNIDCGPIGLQIDISPAQARELAANLIANADDTEAHEAQFAQQELAA